MDEDIFAWVDWIIAEREKKGWSQADLSHAAKISRTAISDYELRRRTNPDDATLSKIAIALGYPPEFLIRIAKRIPPTFINDEHEDRLEKLKQRASRLSEEKLSQYEKYLDFLESIDNVIQGVKSKIKDQAIEHPNHKGKDG